jgi:hypothetical protein
MTEELGSLAQSARGKQLNTARWILIVVGVLTVAVNTGMVFLSEKNVQNEVRQLQKQGLQVDQAEVQKVLTFNRIFLGSLAVLGIVFIVLGIFVYQAPVPCTVAGLSLYVIANVVAGIINPLSIASGIIIKVLIIAGLFKGVQSAFAYSKQENSTEFAS